jgi:hypothetical protein
MKQRNLFRLFVLSFVTFGVYQLLWTKQTRDEMAQRGAKVPPFINLILPFIIAFGLITIALIWGLIVNSAGSEPDGLKVNVPLIIGAVLAIIAVPVVFLHWYYKYCQGVDFVTNGKTSLSFSFFLFVILNVFSVGLIWPLIIQDAFNRLGENNPPQTPQPPSTTPSVPPSTNGTSPIIYSR